MGMSREARAEARAKAEEKKAREAASRATALAQAAKREAAVRETLSRNRSSAPAGEVAPHVFRKAPRLLESSEYLSAVGRMKGPFIRNPRDWEPRGKGRESLFRSLAAHLYSRFPTPAFLWSAFFETDGWGSKLTNLARSLAGGNSFYEEVKTGGFPVPLTRKMCHEVLTGSPSHLRILEAVRLVQVKTAGGDARLWKAWIGTRPGRTLGSESDESFWATVLPFLAANPMFDRTQVGPLTDYIQFRRNENPDFSMKGRSAQALFDAMQTWHGDLQRAKASAGQVFMPSGFRGHESDSSHDGHHGRITSIWRIREILSGKDLAEEGKKNRHCVYSYARSIEARHTSIWSMTHEDNSGNWHALTVEVRNASRTVVQARGIMNRPATGPELNFLHRWADLNSLRVDSVL